MNYYVYKFLDKDNNALYVGQTIDMDRRMSEHKGKIWDVEKDRIEYAVCENMTDMCIYEMYYINKLNAKYNDCLVYNVKPSFTLPELNFKVYDERLIEKRHSEVLEKARQQFGELFTPKAYWNNKKETLEMKIKKYSTESKEYKEMCDEIQKCNDEIDKLDEK